MATTCIQNPPVVTPVKSPIPDKEVSTALQGTVLDKKMRPLPAPPLNAEISP